MGSVHPTLSPSLDIQVASNFERYLFYRLGEDSEGVRALMAEFADKGSITVPGSDPRFAAGRGTTADTLEVISRYWKEHGYLLDPHGAVGVYVAEQNPLEGVPTLCLETAHPGKFPDAIRQALGEAADPRHPALEALQGLPLRKHIIAPEREKIEAFIREALD